MSDDIASTPSKPTFPELQDARLQDIGSFFDDAMDRVQRATRFERRLRTAKSRGGIFLGLLVGAIIVLGGVIWWQKHTLDELRHDIGVAQHTLSGLRAHTFGASFGVTSRGRFVAFPVGTTFDTNWTCSLHDGHKEPCVQVISPR